MEKSFFEEMLSRNYQGTPEVEEKWDARAKHFNLSQQKDRSGLAEKVTNILKEWGILAGAAVLDIGGGSGRYAIPFAEHAEHVTVTDISSNMLELAKNNAQTHGLTNLSYVKTQWESADISALNWNRKFDLSFASMCPAVRSPEGLRKMSEVSKGFCLMNQFITGRDLLSDYLIKELGIKRSHDPHNDRVTVQAVFNLLWLEGYEPEVTYLRQEDKSTYTIGEAIEQYERRYAPEAQSKGFDLKNLIAKYAQGDVVKVSSKSTLAMILWKV
ncbi:class I SAM-dependent methyltransferase [Oscillospiraceae bacterium MB08-C2-2]|nr:class I SAM-dependent methyltransferase [Oscillospiraceae bacterium MB08-C2-2]